MMHPLGLLIALLPLRDLRLPLLLPLEQLLPAPLLAVPLQVLLRLLLLKERSLPLLRLELHPLHTLPLLIIQELLLWAGIEAWGERGGSCVPAAVGGCTGRSEAAHIIISESEASIASVEGLGVHANIGIYRNTQRKDMLTRFHSILISVTKIKFFATLIKHSYFFV